MNWFRKLIQDEIERTGWSQEEAAAAWGVGRHNVAQWLTSNDPNPTLDKLETVLGKMGGDIKRAVPGFDLSAVAEKAIQSEIEEARREIRLLKSTIAEIHRLTDCTDKPCNVYMVAEGKPEDFTKAIVRVGEGSDDPPPPAKKPRKKSKKYPTGEE
jgi:transcriptional regulator with XRE-family HTH domain